MAFIHGDRRGPKRVALTFDDGPDELTHRYLELLDAYGVRATFFLIGSRAERRPDAVKALVTAGHEVAGHGFTHKAFPVLGAAALSDELLHTRDVLPPTTTARPLVRPPKGAVTGGSLFRTFAAGFTTVLWSLDSNDCRTVTPQRVVDAVRPEAVRPGEVVLLHEGQEWTLAALHTIIPRLRASGYELVTVGELLSEA
ncbi:MAG: polysaccharide deacetylase family protein [Polyangiaceae bacterium]